MENWPDLVPSTTGNTKINSPFRFLWKGLFICIDKVGFICRIKKCA
jgi:hypothetical protein